MNTIPDDFDFDAYLKGPDESAMVQPASRWLDEVIQSFERPAIQTGAALPWSSTHNIIRLRRGELSIWPGMSGHGKSMIMGQVALGLMAQGEKVCIASMEMKPASTMQRLCRQAAGCNVPGRRFIRDLHEWTNDRLWLYNQQGQVSPERILALARYCHEQLGITHFVVDNLLSCGIPEDGYDQQKQFVLSLATHAHDTGQAVHLLAHSRKRKDELTPPGNNPDGQGRRPFASAQREYSRHAGGSGGVIMYVACPQRSLRTSRIEITTLPTIRTGSFGGKR
jgi:twinkle protein